MVRRRGAWSSTARRSTPRLWWPCISPATNCSLSRPTPQAPYICHADTWQTHASLTPSQPSPCPTPTPTPTPTAPRWHPRTPHSLTRAGTSGFRDSRLPAFHAYHPRPPSPGEQRRRAALPHIHHGAQGRGRGGHLRDQHPRHVLHGHGGWGLGALGACLAMVGGALGPMWPWWVSGGSCFTTWQWREEGCVEQATMTVLDSA